MNANTENNANIENTEMELVIVETPFDGDLEAILAPWHQRTRRTRQAG